MSKVKESTKIKVIREDLGYTQEQFAEIFNLTLSGYKKMESGEVKLTVDKLYIIKEKLGLSADYVLFDTTSQLVDVWGEVYMLSDVEKWKILMRLYSYLSKKFKNESMIDELLECVDNAVEDYLDQQSN
ncbi:MAG: helix-turn-helix transcriptional regulator [Lachnospiraceae bacterium]|nr:helix-turn-helix transcriptional regulator [Lachnospiraceae bacterium]